MNGQVFERFVGERLQEYPYKLPYVDPASYVIFFCRDFFEGVKQLYKLIRGHWALGEPQYFDEM